MHNSEMTLMSRFRPLNRVYIKVIAFITMTIDHVGMTFFPGTITFRYIGRLAFPLFALGVAEGVANTRNHRKYLFRLALFALISEIPFNLIQQDRMFDIDPSFLEYMDASFMLSMINTNVIFTFLAGACICVMVGKKLKIWEYVLYTLVAVGVLYLNSDYGIYGITMVVISYLTIRYRDLYSGPIVGVVVSSLWVAGPQMWAIMAIIPIILYSGESGRFASDGANRVFSAVNYLFYPVHMLVAGPQMWAIMAIIPIILYSGESGRFASDGANRVFSAVNYLFYPVHMLIIWLFRYHIMPEAVVWHNIFQ